MPCMYYVCVVHKTPISTRSLSLSPNFRTPSNLCSPNRLAKSLLKQSQSIQTNLESETSSLLSLRSFYKCNESSAEGSSDEGNDSDAYLDLQERQAPLRRPFPNMERQQQAPRGARDQIRLPAIPEEFLDLADRYVRMWHGGFLSCVWRRSTYVSYGKIFLIPPFSPRSTLAFRTW